MVSDDDTKLEEHSTIIMDPAYVHINTETEKMVQQFKAEEEKNGIYTIGQIWSVDILFNGRLHDCCQRFSNEFVSGLNRE